MLLSFKESQNKVIHAYVHVYSHAHANQPTTLKHWVASQITWHKQRGLPYKYEAKEVLVIPPLPI